MSIYLSGCFPLDDRLEFVATELPAHSLKVTDLACSDIRTTWKIVVADEG
jgi:hypothetical protein